MAESLTEYMRKIDPAFGSKEQDAVKVGEFPRAKMNNMPEGLPLEDPASFSDDPLDFEESAAMLKEDVLRIYDFSMVLNRFSDKYQFVSRALAKGIAKLASCCVTKTVLEKKGFRFPKIDDLNIFGLYCMVSFHFRKCHAAIKETTNKNYPMWSQLIDIEFGWHTLSERLRATEEKIRNICAGKINVDSMISRAKMFRAQPGSDKPRSVRDLIEGRRPASYPVIGPVVRQMTEKAKALQKAQPEPAAAKPKAEVKPAEKTGAKQAPKSLPAPAATVINNKQKQEDEAYLNKTMRSMFDEFRQQLEQTRGSAKVPIPAGGSRPGRA